MEKMTNFRDLLNWMIQNLMDDELKTKVPAHVLQTWDMIVEEIAKRDDIQIVTDLPFWVSYFHDAQRCDHDLIVMSARQAQFVQYVQAFLATDRHIDLETLCRLSIGILHLSPCFKTKVKSGQIILKTSKYGVSTLGFEVRISRVLTDYSEADYPGEVLVH